jgi:hypothetical protein
LSFFTTRPTIAFTSMIALPSTAAWSCGTSRPSVTTNTRPPASLRTDATLLSTREPSAATPTIDRPTTADGGTR